MSTRLSHHARRTAPLTVTVAAACLLVGAAGPAGADPPALDADACATALSRAGLWPGTMSEGADDVRLVSDAYDGHQSRQPECTSDITDR